MSNNTPAQGRKQTWTDHTHQTPAKGCAACLSRFGTVVGTTVEISEMLTTMGVDNDPLTAAVIQLVWTTNRHLDRIATALEHLGGAS